MSELYGISIHSNSSSSFFTCATTIKRSCNSFSVSLLESLINFLLSAMIDFPFVLTFL